MCPIQSRLAEVLELKGFETAGHPFEAQRADGSGEIRCTGLVLTVQELMDLCHQIVLSGGMKRFFQRLEGVQAPRLQEKALRLASLKSLEKEILRAIDPKGEILDDASPGLSEIRHRIRAVREKAVVRPTD
jgi:dsDNA-specific endonuclease/ATPase MutS2